MSIRILALCACTVFVLTGCEGTGTGRQIFGKPSNNVISTMQLSFSQAPSRSAGTQFLALNVNAYDPWDNIITVLYNNNITLSSNGSGCEIAFSFYQSQTNATASPAPTYSSITYNTPQTIGVSFNPSCGPNPVTITASSPGVASASIKF
jgi:hypothetical protein